jgi:hypothetical protein
MKLPKKHWFILSLFFLFSFWGFLPFLPFLGFSLSSWFLCCLFPLGIFFVFFYFKGFLSKPGSWLSFSVLAFLWWKWLNVWLNLCPLPGTDEVNWWKQWGCYNAWFHIFLQKLVKMSQASVRFMNKVSACSAPSCLIRMWLCEYWNLCSTVDVSTTYTWICWLWISRFTRIDEYEDRCVWLISGWQVTFSVCWQEETIFFSTGTWQMMGSSICGHTWICLLRLSQQL